MFDKMKQLMEMKNQADKIKKELDGEIVQITDVKGLRIVVNGSMNFQAVEIDENLLKPENKKNLERDLLRSLNAAIHKSQVLAASKMKALMPGFPGL